MKFLTLILFSIPMLYQAQTKGVIKDISANEFKVLIEQEKGILLDVRTPGEVATGTIPNASVIDFYDAEFLKKINLMDKSKEIYVYCKGGGRSSQAATILAENGFKTIYNLSGGIMAWENMNYPITKPTQATDEHIQEMSVEDFQKLISTQQPVLVDFHTIWCAPCKKMAPIIDDLEKAYTGKAIVLRIDVDKSKALAKHYQVQGVPVFMLFQEGKVIWKDNGMQTKQTLEEQLNKVIQKH